MFCFLFGDRGRRLIVFGWNVMESSPLQDLRQLCLDAELDLALINELSIVESGPHRGIVFLPVPFENAIAVWFQFRSIFDGTGRFPVICPMATVKYEWRRNVQDERNACSVESVIESAKRVENCDWILHMRDRFDAEIGFGSWAGKPHELLDERGEWPERFEPRHEFYLPEFWGRKDGKVAMYLPVCDEPWMIPAHLRASKSNHLPSGVHQCAMLRRWNRIWGAEPVCCYGSFYELHVSRPPTDRNAALNLAYEHAWLCYDRINQVSPDPHALPPGNVNTGVLERLAAALLNSSVWYLWWD